MNIAPVTSVLGFGELANPLSAHVDLTWCDPCDQEAIAITMEPLPLSPRDVGAVMPYAA
jgi:hypothetical protein